LEHHAATCQGDRVVVVVDDNDTVAPANAAVTEANRIVIDDQNIVSETDNSNGTQRMGPVAMADSTIELSSISPVTRTQVPIPTPQISSLTYPRMSPLLQPARAIHSLPPGLYLYPNFVSEDEERHLLAMLDDPHAIPAWNASRFNGQSYGKRWGVHCNLRDRRVDAPEHALPSILMETVVQKLARLSCWTTRLPLVSPNEANAIDYRKVRGDWLQAHVDDRKLSKEPIVNLSLAGDCIMTYGNTKKRTLQHPDEIYRVSLPNRCLQVLTGPARYNYTHAIANVDLQSNRRVSITLRESPLSAGGSTTSTMTASKRATPKIDTIFGSKNIKN
jgi:alkylated DNA repair protein alkB family protein 4